MIKYNSPLGLKIGTIVKIINVRDSNYSFLIGEYRKIRKKEWCEFLNTFIYKLDRCYNLDFFSEDIYLGEEKSGQN